ncbi:MAG: YqaJ viral recombinase family protein [Spirochaetia bacterium]|nr:YqaJ viral recombinase family protein [Spirochaetia bacterium]
MKRINCKDHKAWLGERTKGIGGSDAATVLQMNKYKSITELYLEKIGKKEPEDLSGNLRVQYGNNAESPLRDLFALDFPEYEIYHSPYEILIDEEYDYLRASVDGELTASGVNGVLEIKTAEPRNAEAWAQWKDSVPDNYYCQILHYLMVTGYDFAILTAHLIHTSYNESLTWAEDRRYFFDRKDVEDDIQTLKEAEIKFWNENIIPRVAPNVKLRLGA